MRLVTWAALGLIAALAFGLRVVVIARNGWTLQEPESFFNFRMTQALVEQGPVAFSAWHDTSVSHPVGRIVASSIHPGLHATAAAVFYLLDFLSLGVSLESVCLLFAPAAAALATTALFALTVQVKGPLAALIAAALLALSPSIVSHTLAGSFSPECLLALCLCATLALWLRAMRTGSRMFAALCALAIGYTSLVSNAHPFAVNVIALHVAVLLIQGRVDLCVLKAFATATIGGAALSARVPVVGVQLFASPAMLVPWLVLAAAALARIVPPLSLRACAAFGAAAAGVLAALLSRPPGARELALAAINPLHRGDPVIASVAEHQPSSWAALHVDLHLTAMLAVPGLLASLRSGPAGMLLALFAVTSLYLAAVMVRHILLAGPAFCALGGIGAAGLVDAALRSLTSSGSAKAEAKRDGTARLRRQIGLVTVAVLAVLATYHTLHCTWAATEAYASPSLFLSARLANGTRVIYDDFREAYSWLRENTPQSASVLAWWDHGFIINGLANRTTFADGCTDSARIAEIGQIFVSSEEQAASRARALGATHVLVQFGGMTGYSSDDLNKLLWMARIAAEHGLPVEEDDFFSAAGAFLIGRHAPAALRDSLLYRLSYHRFGTQHTEKGKPRGYDRVRGEDVAEKQIHLSHFEEVYTSPHWLVRIYRVLPLATVISA